MKRGPYKGKKHLLSQAIKFRTEGYGYGTIGRKLGVPLHTVRNWVEYIKVDKVICQKIADQKRWEPSLEESKTQVSRRKALVRLRGRRCERCLRETWEDVPIPLDLHHIDGNRQNNEETNLSLLCPNCHSLTENFGSKNSKRWKNAFGEGIRLPS